MNTCGTKRRARASSGSRDATQNGNAADSERCQVQVAEGMARRLGTSRLHACPRQQRLHAQPS
eukprot:5153278-Prymnesium_polylepis.1